MGVGMSVGVGGGGTAIAEELELVRGWSESNPVIPTPQGVELSTKGEERSQVGQKREIDRESMKT
eukprot:3034018-Alexandrium_andersonii.AAC.1